LRLQPPWQTLDEVICFSEVHSGFHGGSVPHLIDVAEADVLLDGRVELGEALEDGRRVSVVLFWVKAADVGPIDEEGAFLEVGDAEEDFSERRFAY
jgi:hypothetical protein